MKPATSAQSKLLQSIFDYIATQHVFPSSTQVLEMYGSGAKRLLPQLANDGFLEQTSAKGTWRPLRDVNGEKVVFTIVMKKEVTTAMKLKRWMLEHGTSEQDLALVLECQTGDLRAWLEGKSNPDLRSAYRIERVAGIEPKEWLQDF